MNIWIFAIILVILMSIVSFILWNFVSPAITTSEKDVSKMQSNISDEIKDISSTIEGLKETLK